MAEETFDAIVIGAGFGGASCAGLLARSGLRTLLLEKNAVAGGKAMTFSRGGFTSTAWVVIGAPVQGNLYEAVLRELDAAGEVELVAADSQGSIYRAPDGSLRELPADPRRRSDPEMLFDWLGIPQPRRAAALDFFVRLVSMPPEEVRALEGRTFEAWLREHDLPRPLYAFVVSLCCDGMFMVPADLLDAAEAVASLRKMFTQGGGLFCRGGFGRVAEACCRAVQRFGGQVRFRTRVTRVLVEQGRAAGVQTTAGTFRAPIVVSNAGIQPTVLRLVGQEHFSPDYVAYVKSLVPSWALLGYRYFLRAPITDRCYGVVFSDTSPWSSERLRLAREGKASREGVLYYEVPSNYDPQAAPPGKQLLLTGSFCPPDPAMSDAEVAAWARAGEEILFAAFPGLPELIEEKHLYTPRAVSRATRDAVLPGVGGETIGLAQIAGQCGSKKPAIESPVPGLFLVGCDAGGTGVGTQQAIDSGRNVARAVVRRHRELRAA